MYREVDPGRGQLRYDPSRLGDSYFRGPVYGGPLRSVGMVGAEHQGVLLAVVMQERLEIEPATHRLAKSRTGSIVFLKRAPVAHNQVLIVTSGNTGGERDFLAHCHNHSEPRQNLRAFGSFWRPNRRSENLYLRANLLFHG
jgi:hypothetical protein